MAGPFYVEPGTGNDGNAGTNWGAGNSWATLQKALDTLVAGEICYCKGTETIAAQIDVDTVGSSGSNAAGWPRFIGVNSSGNRDGTRYIVNGNSAAIHGIVFNGGQDMVWLENIEVQNCGAGGDSKDGIRFATANTTGPVIVNCASHNNSGYGFNNGFCVSAVFARCTSFLNTLAGFTASAGTIRYLFCSSHDNTASGWNVPGADVFYGCLSYDNGDDGITSLPQSATVLQSVINGNADDGIILLAHTTQAGPPIVGTRITNQNGATDIGLNANSEPLLTMANYFEDNSDANIQNDTVHQNISIDGTGNSSNVEDTAGQTNEGYTSLTDGSQDFNLRSDAAQRRTAITIPVA